MIKISVINVSTVVTDDEVKRFTAAVQAQVSRDFVPAWGLDAIVEFIPKGQPVPLSWELIVGDTSDQVGALGYHDLTSNGLPIGKVFAKTDQMYGASVSVTMSHETLEMLADPWINGASQAGRKFYATEICDPVESDSDGYFMTLPDGTTVLVSNFVFPQWFEISHNSSVPLDQMHKLTTPFQLLPSGFISVWDTAGNNTWQQIYGRTIGLEYSKRAVVGSRREKRNTPREEWIWSVRHV